MTGELVPRDDGFGASGNGAFNTLPLAEAADTGLSFHNNSIATAEGPVVIVWVDPATLGHVTGAAGLPVWKVQTPRKKGI